MNFLTTDELLAVLKTARACSMRDWLMILISYRYGLRASEITGLRTTDINNGCITVQRRKHSKQTTQQITGHRGEPLLNVERGLREYMRARPADASEAVFPSAKGGFLCPKSFNFIFKQHALAAGVHPLKAHPHILKHSIANHLLRAGVNLAFVQNRLGHASLSSTQQYLSVSNFESDEKAESALMGLF